MSLDKKQLIEITGVAAVVASLLFVGAQLILDRRIARSDQYASRAESMKSDLRAQLESESWMSGADLRWEAGERPGWWPTEFENDSEELGYSGREVWADIITSRLMLLQMDNLYFQYDQGLLPDESWGRMRRTIKGFLSNENRYDKYTYPVYSGPLLIQPLIEEILIEIENENGITK
jgi:hypothetical protein